MSCSEPESHDAQRPRRAHEAGKPLEQRHIVQHVLAFASAEGFLFLAGVSRLWEEETYPPGERPSDIESDIESVYALMSDREPSFYSSDTWKGSSSSSLCSSTDSEIRALRKRQKRTTLAAAVSSAPRIAWALDSRLEWDFHVSRITAKHPSGLEALKWGLGNGHVRFGERPLDRHPEESDQDLCKWAAGAGQLETLKWLRANGCPWAESTCSHAARRGHLNIFKWARANHCEWDVTTCEYAARGGHLRVLQWCRAKKCPWDCMTCDTTNRERFPALWDWIHANRCPCKSLHREVGHVRDEWSNSDPDANY